MLQNILYTFVTGFVGTLVTFLCVFLKNKITELTQNKYIKFATDSIIDAVNTVSMQYVDDLKKAGTFTEEAKINAKARALFMLNDLMTTKTMKVLTDVYGDYETWINTKIESVLKEKKWD